MPSIPEPPLPRPFPGGLLRRLRPSDLEAFQDYRGIPGLGRFQGWSPMSEIEALEFLVEMESAPLFRRGRWIQLGIADPDGDVLVGDIGLHLSTDGQGGEVGFTLAPSAQGRGVAGRAVREALRLFFAHTAAVEVLGITDVRNTPSVRLLVRLGFEERETRRTRFRGEEITEQVFGLNREMAALGNAAV